METIVVLWRLSVLVGVFVFPQLLGILLYFRLRRAPRWIAVIVAALAPAAVFFWIIRIVFIAGLREGAAASNGCGMPALGAALMLLAGTAIQLVLGFVVQVILSKRARLIIKSNLRNVL
jgi:hypothetical protein